MKNRKFMQVLAIVVFVCISLSSNAARKDEVTLLMVPREDKPVQLGMDLANKYPLLLISYVILANNSVSLHGWTGTQWVNVTVEDFLAGNFFHTGPDSALLVESPGLSLPANAIPPAEWCPSVFRITTTEMRPLLHLTGQYFDFSYKNWQWFAKRYGKSIDDINPEGLNVAWYNKPMKDHFTQTSSLGASDLQYWESIRQPIAVDAVEIETIELDVTDEPVQEPEAVGEIGEVDNPLTNEVSSAVIMGAADASEEVSPAPISIEVQNPVEPEPEENVAEED